ncbi:MAG: alanine--tRNA ligase, partial [Campylobacter sp.]|nr:alanine--tRNA ligase [Campylobacter sp.]
LAKTKDIFSGEVAFKLYDTYGFPLDLTADMLREKGLSVDAAKFDILMSEQKARAKASWKGSGDAAKESGDFKELLEKFGKNEFIGYDSLSSTSRVLALLNNEFKIINKLSAGESGYIMLDKTPFYAQSGGQCGDSGKINDNKVLDTKKYFELNLSQIQVSSTISVGDEVECKVSPNRLEIRRHHSATHLLHAALRSVLGSHISQAGSSVEADKLRFDFSHPKPVSSDELAQIEKFVNDQIQAGAKAKVEIMDINSAKNSGAIALFGEKYSDEVRVLTLGCSKELCGGTHVENINEIGSFFITKESGVSAGVRRIEAVCSRAALNYANELRNELEEIKASLKGASPIAAIAKLKDEIKSLQNEIKNTNSSVELDSKIINGINVVVDEFNGDIKAKIDEIKNKFDSVVIFLASAKDGKVMLAAGSKNCNIKAGELVKAIAPIVGGGGGGRDDFATAGGKDISKISNALEEANKLIKSKL